VTSLFRFLVVLGLNATLKLIRPSSSSSSSSRSPLQGQGKGCRARRERGRKKKRMATHNFGLNVALEKMCEKNMPVSD